MSIGIIAYATYLPRHRLRGADVAAARGQAGGKGERRVAAYDEDALTMAVEAGRLLSGERLAAVTSLAFCATSPPYAGKNNASAAHAALALAEDVPAYDAGGAYRSPLGVLVRAHPGTLLLAGDVTAGRPDDADELLRGDAAAAFVFGSADPAVEIVESVSLTEELIDHWRAPGQLVASSWEERFAVERYTDLVARMLGRLKTAAVDHVIVSSPGARTARGVAKPLAKLGPLRTLDGLGHCGAADPLVRLAHVLDSAEPDQTILLITLADGLDALVLRTTDRLGSARPRRATAPQLDAARPVNYLDYLSWRGFVERAGPRRPDPAMVSAPASARNGRWKFGLTASRCLECGKVQAPPQRVCVRCAAVDRGEPAPLSTVGGTIRTFSVDRLAYSLNPPVVAAVVDFDGGGRFELELADPVVDALAVGQRVRMTFRRRHSSGGVHNYAWKAISEETTDD